MYTSGSTGKPKGVEVTHRGIVRLVKNTNYIQFDRTDVVGQIANASFDAITFEVWGALLNGGTLVVLNNETVLSPLRFAEAIRQHGITTMFLTSALFNLMMTAQPAAFGSMRNLLVGGDAVDPRSARKLLETAPPARFVNGYGPTECTTFSVCHLIDHVPEDARIVPIGRPISNSQAFILDSALHPVPPGAAGELYLGGDGLARGYRNRPQLTAERFIPHPFDPSPGARLYKTGDMARYREDGIIECLGRTDNQIKLRGFRIELGEIEATLRAHPDVEDCAAAVHGTDAANRHIVAYIVGARASANGKVPILEFLRARLPEFMIPSAVVFLDALPLSPAGKIDRNALPPPASPSAANPPETELQRILSDIWRNALGTGAGLDDNFFDLGGNSLTIAAAGAEIERTIHVELAITDLFRYPTIRTLADYLSQGAQDRWRAAALDRGSKQRSAFDKQRKRPAMHVTDGEVHGSAKQ